MATIERTAETGAEARTDRVPGDVELTIMLGLGDPDAERQLMDRHRDAVADLGPSDGFESVDSSGHVTAAMIRNNIGKNLPFRAAWLSMHAQGTLPMADERRNPTWDAFCTLPAAWQLAMWHREVEGQSTEQIAHYLGTSVEAAERALAQGYSSLKRKVALHHAEKPVSAECEHLQGTYRFNAPASLTKGDARALRNHGAACPSCTVMTTQLLVLEHRLRDTLAGVVLGSAASRYLELRPQAGLRVVGGAPIATRRRRAPLAVAAVTAAAVGVAAALSALMGPTMIPALDVPSAAAAPMEVPVSGSFLEPAGQADRGVAPLRTTPAPAAFVAAAPAVAPAAASGSKPGAAGSKGAGSGSKAPNGPQGNGGSGPVTVESNGDTTTVTVDTGVTDPVVVEVPVGTPGKGAGSTGSKGATGLSHASTQGATHGTRSQGRPASKPAKATKAAHGAAAKATGSVAGKVTGKK